MRPNSFLINGSLTPLKYAHFNDVKLVICRWAFRKFYASPEVECSGICRVIYSYDIKLFDKENSKNYFSVFSQKQVLITQNQWVRGLFPSYRIINN
jgi:hypothetical protein